MSYHFSFHTLFLWQRAGDTVTCGQLSALPDKMFCRHDEAIHYCNMCTKPYTNYFCTLTRGLLCTLTCILLQLCVHNTVHVYQQYICFPVVWGFFSARGSFCSIVAHFLPWGCCTVKDVTRKVSNWPKTSTRAVRHTLISWINPNTASSS